MNKSKKNKRYRGGDAGDGIMSFFSNAWNSTKKNSQELLDNLTGKNKTYSSNSGISTYDNTNSNSNTNYNSNINSNTNSNPISSSTSVSNSNNIANRYNVGGRKVKRRYKKLSKRGGNKMAYSSASVNKMLVAEPTYWIKGGKTKKRRRRKYK
jgi:hypothetical protein